MKNLSIIGTETDTNYEINDTLSKIKCIMQHVLKKCNEREHLRTLHLKARIKPVGKKEFTFVWATVRSAVTLLLARGVLNIEFYNGPPPDQQ